MYGYIVTFFTLACAVSAQTTTSEAASTSDAGHIDNASTVELDNPELYVVVRSFFAEIAEEIKTVSGYESIYAEATAAVAQITDNEAAKVLLTATDPTATA